MRKILGLFAISIPKHMLTPTSALPCQVGLMSGHKICFWRIFRNTFIVIIKVPIYLGLCNTTSDFNLELELSDTSIEVSALW